MRAALRSFGRFVAELVRAQHRDKLMLHAGALAYTTLLSLVPILTVLLVAAASVDPERGESLVRGIAAVLPFSPEQVQSTLAAFARRTVRLGWLAIAVSFVITLNAFYQIEEVINTVWGVARRRQWRRRLGSFAALMVSGPLLLAVLFSFLYWLSSRPWYPVIAPLGRPLPALFAVAALTALYRWVPNTNVPWRAALAGAGVATFALLTLHVGFQEYLTLAVDVNVIYGSLTFVLFFLVSLFLFWFAVLLGAEASWVVGHAPQAAPQPEVEQVLALLVEVHRRGHVDPERAATLVGEATIQRLLEEPAILTRSPEGYQLDRASDAITVAEVLGRLAPIASAQGGKGDEVTLASLAKQLDGDSGEQPVPRGEVLHRRDS